MIANDANDDENGSGIAEYMYFVDNKAGTGDTIVRKTVGTDTNPNTATFNTTIGRYLGQVAVVDKAGNVSNVTGNPDARTKMYKFDVYAPSAETWVETYHETTDWTNALVLNPNPGFNTPSMVHFSKSNGCYCWCSVLGYAPDNLYADIIKRMPADTVDTPVTNLCKSGYSKYLQNWQIYALGDVNTAVMTGYWVGSPIGDCYTFRRNTLWNNAIDNNYYQ